MSRGSGRSCALLLLWVACAHESHEAPPLERGAQWLDRALEKSWTGLLVSADERDSLLALAPKEAIRRIVSDPRFGNGVLAFNLEFLGWPLPALHTVHSRSGRRVFDSRVTWKPQAVASAQEVTRGGDYFRIVDDSGPWVFYPNAPSRLLADVPMPVDWATMDESQRRRTNLAAAQALFEELRAMLGQGDVSGACARWNSARHVVSSGWLASGFNEPRPGLGYSNAILRDLLLGAVAEQDCERVDGPALLAWLSELEALVDGTYRMADDAPAAAQETVDDILVVKAEAYALRADRPLFAPSEVLPLKNTSTNMNRRRAAYILSTYFCDDMTAVPLPLDAELDTHGEAPSCQGCHYKLDPLAGFFRYTDDEGSTDPTREWIRFSDNETFWGESYAQYLDHWKSVDNTWRVGYVRSPQHPELTSWGQSLGDLPEILREAPELPRCVVQRLAEYYLGADQAVDGAWLAHLADGFGPGPGSADHFREIAAAILLSDAFAEPDPHPERCYDVAPGRGPRALPCAVAHVLETHCLECHRGDHPSGGLDLGAWEEESGRFSHFDGGRRLGAEESMSRLLQRLTSLDPERAMPPLRYVETRERQILYEWLRARGGRE